MGLPAPSTQTFSEKVVTSDFQPTLQSRLSWKLHENSKDTYTNKDSFMIRFATIALLGVMMILQCTYAVTSANEPVSLDSGFHQMYNLDFAAAHKTFETWQVQHPNDPLGAASNPAAYLFSEFERLHILALD